MAPQVLSSHTLTYSHVSYPHILEDSREQSPAYRKSAEYKGITQFFFFFFLLTKKKALLYFSEEKLFTMMTHFSLLYWTAILSDGRWGCLAVRLLYYKWSKESPAATTEHNQK